MLRNDFKTQEFYQSTISDLTKKIRELENETSRLRADLNISKARAESFRLNIIKDHKERGVGVQ